jgi:phosphohistidine phosphatase
MELYFLRHAPAIQRGIAQFPNDDRPLTEEGTQKMKKGARGLRTLLPRVDLICSSPLVRAFDTAKIAAEALNYTAPVLRCDQLLPEAGFREFLSLMEDNAGHEAVLVVGHEPNMGKTISALLGASRVMIELKKGGLCKIRVDGTPDGGSGTLIYHLTPRQLRLMA